MTTDNPTDARIRRRTRRCHPNPSAHPRETGKTDGGVSHDGRDGRCSDFASSIVWRETEQLKPNAGNARTHSKKQIRQIVASIREFGFTNPVLIDTDDVIIAGHGRVEAAKVLRLDTVPTLLVDHLTEDQKRAYIIADSRLAELAGYPGVNSLRAGRLEELAMHPTLKPVALVADAIRDCSKRNGRVLDAFAGSGTTIIAAARTGRIGYGLELDPRYVDVAVRRWMKISGEAAIHDETGLPFDVMADRRRPDPALEDPGDATRACSTVEQGHV